MLTIDLRGSKKKVDQILAEESINFSRAIIEGVCDAVDKNVSRVTCLVVLTDSEVFSFTASRSYYIQTLQANIINMIKVEEYELCAKAVQYIKRLEMKLLN